MTDEEMFPPVTMISYESGANATLRYGEFDEVLTKWREKHQVHEGIDENGSLAAVSLEKVVCIYQLTTATQRLEFERRMARRLTFPEL